MTEEEKEVYQRLINEVYPEVSEMITNPLIEQGRQEGIQQGIQQGLQKSVVRILSRKFRRIPQDLQEKISYLTDIQKLQNLLDASVEAKSLDELRTNGFFDG